MDIVTLALAKAHSDGQRIAYSEKNTITYDGSGETIDLLGDGSTFAKVQDNPIDLLAVTAMQTNESVGININYLRIVAESGVQFAYILADNGATEWILVINAFENNDAGIPKGLYVQVIVSSYIARIETETIHTIDPKYLPVLDSVTLNSPSGKQYTLTIDDTGAVTTTEVKT